MTAVAKITLESLAQMIQKQCAAIDARFNSIEEKMVTKDELRAVETRLDMRLDRIENIILTDHRNRLERVEDRLRLLETARKQ